MVEEKTAPLQLQLQGMVAVGMNLTIIFRCFLQLTRRHKRNIRFALCTIIATLAIHRVFHYMFDHTSSELSQPNQTKLILVYTRFPYEPWGPKTVEEAQSYKFADWDGSPCEESRCQITFDRSLLNVSDAVLFHAVALSPRLDIEELTRMRLPAQRWVLYTKESPGVLPIAPRYNGLHFNWTATYRRDSDFFVPYGDYVSLEIQNNPVGKETRDDAGKITIRQKTKTGGVDVQTGNNINHARGKDKMAVFGTSQHCGGHRYAFVRALMKHVKVSELIKNVFWTSLIGADMHKGNCNFIHL